MPRLRQLIAIMPASPKYYEGGFTDIVRYTAVIGEKMCVIWTGYPV